MLKSRILWLILLVMASFGVVQAQVSTAPGLLVYNAWLRPTAAKPPDDATPAAPIPGTVSGAYVTIENIGKVDYSLVGVDVGFAEMSMLHQSTVDAAGVMRMRMVMGGIDIPVGETVQLAPGGYHAMLMNVTDNVYPGQAVALTLTFEDADGASYAVPVGALATDLPPEDETLLAANAVAQPVDDGLDISLILDNRGDTDETLTGVSIDFDATVTMLTLFDGRVQPYTTIDVPAHAQTIFAPDAVAIRLTDLAETPAGAFPVTLKFESGRTLTVAIPITGAAT